MFPALVGNVLENVCKNAISLRPHFVFSPLINLTYADNAPMVTYGGIVLSGDEQATFDRLELEHLTYLLGPPQFELAVPNLTIKEKMRFDQLLPRVGMPSPVQLGFELRDKEIEAYVKFYLEYPVFGEYQF